MTVSLSDWAAPRREQVDALLSSLFSQTWPDAFGEACTYPLTTGGKRIRPLLSLAAAEAIGRPMDPTLVAVGGAVELIHTYSLVHDDLPCMDDDDERRGKPTVHKAYGDGPALLVGDALLTEAFTLLASLDLPATVRIELVAELSRAAGARGMVGGQAADIGMAGPVSELELVSRLHRGKTGALIRAATCMGGIAAGASPEQVELLTRYGTAVGLAFQLADDLLDKDEDAGADGPPSFVKVLGEDQTRARAQQLADTAEQAAHQLPQPDALAALARFTVDRDH